MSAERFQVVEVNPNDAVGGGGCLCSEDRNPDCKGPFAVFFHGETNSNISPHPVLCLGCADAFVKRAESDDILAGGESNPESDAPSDVDGSSIDVQEGDDEVPEV